MPKDKTLNVSYVSDFYTTSNPPIKTNGVFVHSPSFFKTGMKDGTDIIFINVNNPTKVISDTAFHEPLHNFGFGVPITQEAAELYKTKLKFALIPREQVPDKYKWCYDYITRVTPSVNEGIVNYAEIGRSLGLKPGQPRPSKEEVIELLDKAKEIAPHKEAFINLLNKDKWYRAWDLLTGVYNKGGKIKRQP